MGHWLMKSEPDAYSWERLVKDGKGSWDGVRNHQAANNLRAMKKGDRAFFYHSNIGKEIVGVMEIAAEARPDHTDDTGKWVEVGVRPVAPLKTPVTLESLRGDSRFSEFLLIRHTRLSVMPVSDAHWRLICKLGGVDP